MRISYLMRHDLWSDLRTIWKQLDEVIQYEAGELDEPSTIRLYQSLIDSGLAWTLRGNYGRTAAELIEMGVCHDRLQTRTARHKGCRQS